METCSARPPTLTRGKAWLCTILNLFAFPGMGTWMGGRRWAGLGQILVVLAGTGFLCGFFVAYLRSYVEVAMSADLNAISQNPDYHPYLWSLYLGAGLVGLAWFWSLISSLQLLYRAKPTPKRTDPRLPRPPSLPPDLP